MKVSALLMSFAVAAALWALPAQAGDPQPGQNATPPKASGQSVPPAPATADASAHPPGELSTRAINIETGAEPPPNMIDTAAQKGLVDRMKGCCAPVK